MNNIVIKNIYYMLSYAFLNIRLDEKNKINSEDFDNIYNLFAEIISQGVAKQLKQGLYREYINKNENLNTIRGSVNIEATMKNIISNRKKINCDYDEISENNIFNKILKATMLMLIRTDKVDYKYKINLKKEIMYFSEVDDINLAQLLWNRLSFTRNNRSYRVLITMCQFISESLIITSEKGNYRLREFIDDQRMNRLYEKFILEYYRKEHPYLKAKSSQIPWDIDNENRTLLPVMQSDIMLEKEDKILIIDAKYYSKNFQERFDKKTLISANMYQIFTYVKNKQYEVKDNAKVSGMLLYARTNDEDQPESEYVIHGNKIIKSTLDLNCEFKEIRKQLDKIAGDNL